MRPFIRPLRSSALLCLALVVGLLAGVQPKDAARADGTLVAARRIRTTAAQGSGWTRPRYDLHATGFNPTETELTAATVGTLRPLWIRKGEGMMDTAPDETGGVVYVGGDVAGQDTSELYALDAATGVVLWHRRTSGAGPSDISVVRGRLYVSFLFSHILRAYDAASGQVEWTFGGPTFAPAVADGVVYAADDLNRLWAVDASTGSKLWVARTHLGGYGFGLAVAYGRVYVGGTRVNQPSPVFAYDTTTGTLVWKHMTQGRVYGTPAVSGGIVYAGSTDSRFYALDARTGAEVWTFKDPAGIQASAATDGRRVYEASSDGTVYSFDARSGRREWRARTPGKLAGASIIQAADVVYVGADDGTVDAFEAATGHLLWSYVTGGPVHGLSVADGRLYVTSADFKIYAFAPSP